jgi:tetratricopeptide (TPR) repeat protein
VDKAKAKVGFMSDAERHFNAGVHYLRSKKLDAAERSFAEVLKTAHNHVPTLLNLALVGLANGQTNKSEKYLRQAIGAQQDNVDANLLLSRLLLAQRRFHEAVEALDKAGRINPSLIEVHCNKAAALNEIGNYQCAKESALLALKLNPKHPESNLTFGNILFNLGDYGSACEAYRRTLSCAPGHIGAWLGLGNSLVKLCEYEEALAVLGPLVERNPPLAGAFLARANAYADTKRYAEALNDYEKALALHPGLAEAWVSRGTVFYNLNRDAEALQCYEKALGLDECSADANFNKALLKLALGEYEEGWRLYECRWKSRYFPSPARNFAQPLWLDNADLGNKTILIHAEQGLGDAIQFSRYLDLLNDKHCKVIFEVDKPLVPLFKSQPADWQIITAGDAIPRFDVHCPLMSLPLAFKTTLESIPAKIPYILASEGKKNEWASRLGPKTKKRIGLAWSGNPRFAGGNDILRPIPLSVLSPILRDDLEWHRLQKDLRPADQAALRSLPLIRDHSSLIEDFSDTAALIGELDLVISIDTSVAHLAGALGKPVWIMLSFHCDFRWLRDRTDSPWYPTARLFRQRCDGDWNDVTVRVVEALKTLDLEIAAASRPSALRTDCGCVGASTSRRSGTDAAVISPSGFARTRR